MMAKQLALAITHDPKKAEAWGRTIKDTQNGDLTAARRVMGNQDLKNIHDMIHQAAQQAAAAKDAAAQGLQTASDSVSTTAHQASDAITSTAHQASDAVSSTTRDVESSAKQREAAESEQRSTLTVDNDDQSPGAAGGGFFTKEFWGGLFTRGKPG